MEKFLSRDNWNIFEGVVEREGELRDDRDAVSRIRTSGGTDEEEEEGEESCKGGFGRRRMTGTRAKSGRAGRAGHGGDEKEDEEQTRRLGSVGCGARG